MITDGQRLIIARATYTSCLDGSIKGVEAINIIKTQFKLLDNKNKDLLNEFKFFIKKINEKEEVLLLNK